MARHARWHQATGCRERVAPENHVGQCFPVCSQGQSLADALIIEGRTAHIETEEVG